MRARGKGALSGLSWPVFRTTPTPRPLGCQGLHARESQVQSETRRNRVREFSCLRHGDVCAGFSAVGTRVGGIATARCRRGWHSPTLDTTRGRHAGIAPGAVRSRTGWNGRGKTAPATHCCSAGTRSRLSETTSRAPSRRLRAPSGSPCRCRHRSTHTPWRPPSLGNERRPPADPPPASPCKAPRHRSLSAVEVSGRTGWQCPPGHRGQGYRATLGPPGRRLERSARASRRKKGRADV